MSLYERLQDRGQAREGAVEAPLGGTAAARAKRSQALNELREQLHHRVIEDLGPLLYDRQMSREDLRDQVGTHLNAVLQEVHTPMSSAARSELLKDVSDDILGYGPLERFLADPEVTEVMANGPSQIYIERAGRLHLTDGSFTGEVHLRRLIDKIVAEVGRRIDEATPMVDARLPDGSRVNAVIHPLAIGGPFLTVRKFSKDPLRVADLIAMGSMTPEVARFLEVCVASRLNVVVSGGTGSGKTTTLNVLSSFIPAGERIVTIEDAKELQLLQEHVLTLEARPPNIEGKGQITIRDLVRNALRMRPDRIVVGECRSGEALDMLQAMNTGHDGSLTTVHSNSPRDTLSRIETMTLMAGFDLPVRVIREQMSSALDLIVHLSRLRDGSRRITHVTEVQHLEGDIIVLQDVFLFDHAAGFDDDGRHQGHLVPTGIRPKITEKVEDAGLSLDAELFAAPPRATASNRRSSAWR